jgi:hypothetical protein
MMQPSSFAGCYAAIWVWHAAGSCSCMPTRLTSVLSHMLYALLTLGSKGEGGLLCSTFCVCFHASLHCAHTVKLL